MKRRRDGSACRRWTRLAWAVAATSLGSAQARPVTRYGSGSVTYLSDISRAGCGFLSWPHMAETHYAAVLSPGGVAPTNATSATHWASACGRCARVWCDDERLCPRAETATTTNSAVVYIVEDQRTRWNWNANSNANADLNLSPRVFQNLTGSDAGRVPVRWRFVDCPPFRSFSSTDSVATPPNPSDTTTPVVEDPVACAVCVRNDSSAYLLSLQPVNDTLGVASLRVDGARATRLTGSPSFFFSIADRLGRLNLSRLEISLTTRNRRRFTRVVSVRPGECVDVRRSDELPSGDGGAPTAPVSPSPESPSGSDTTDGQGDEYDDNGEGDDGVATLPPPATRTPGSNSGSFVVLPGRPSASNSPPESLIVPPNSPSLTISPIIRPATRPVSPSEASPPPPPAPFAPLVPTLPPVSPPSAPSGAPPAPQVPPVAIDKDGAWPTQDPPGTGSGALSRPPPSPTTAGPPSAPSAGDSPQPTSGGRTPVGHLSGGVLTNPVFVGVLLGTVGLVGAVVAYRAKASQRARLALVPPVTTAAAGPTSRAVTYVSATATPREEVATL